MQGLVYPIVMQGRCDTTDDFTTTPFNLVQSSFALVELAKSITAHCLILSFHLFFFFHSLCPVEMSYDRCSGRAKLKPEDLETWPNHLSFRFLTTVRSSSYSPLATWIFLRTSFFGYVGLVRTVQLPSVASTSKAFILFSCSAVKVHESQAYRNMEMTRKHISFTFDQSECCYLSILASGL